MRIENFDIGRDKVFLVAEIGKNHNGDISIAKHLIEQAFFAGFDCVKISGLQCRDTFTFWI